MSYIMADMVKIDTEKFYVLESRKETDGINLLVDFGNNNKQWVHEDDTHEVRIECNNCDEENWVEAGTWALDRGLCYSCNLQYEGGN